VGQLLFLIVMVWEGSYSNFIHHSFRDFGFAGAFIQIRPAVFYKYYRLEMDISFGGFPKNSVIDVLSTVTKFSTCDNLLYLDDFAFSTFAILGPLVAKLCFSCSASSKINNMA
jgi:hypothetical protein